MEAFSNIFSAFGLSASAGLNAYLPLLVVAVSARLNLVELNNPWDVLASGWVIGTLLVLILIEMTVDKIPFIDSINDIVQTVGRPAAGAVLFAANSGAVGEVSPVLACVAGLLLAGTVHAVKTTARPAVTATTGGTGNWAVSLAEDGLALTGAVLSLVFPVLMAVFVCGFFLAAGWWWVRRRDAALA